jgi:streptogramin lyase
METSMMRMNSGEAKGKRVSVAAMGVATGIAMGSLLAGCSAGLTTSFPTGGATSAVQPMTGKVYGGSQPVIGANVQLFAVGTAGTGSAATSILTNPVSTGQNGGFNLANDYSCTTPVAATQVYLVATGGNSGANGSNSAIALMAPLGDCATVQAAVAAGTYPAITINEVTTVAAAYALAPFMTDYSHTGASGTNAAGLLNAAANFNRLANLNTGAAGGASLPSGANVPVSEINAIANILAACVNTTGNSSGACNTLLSATGATDTVGAALAFAKNPGSPALTALTSLITGTPAFNPSLSTSPNDWTVAIKYNAGGTLSAPYGVAIDASGNAWITNTAGSALTELSPSGSVVNTVTNAALTGAKGIAIDRSNNLWVTNPYTNAVLKLNGSGAVQATATTGGLSGPVSIAVNSSGNVYVANLTGNSITGLDNTATPLSANGSNGFTAGGTISVPAGVAIDSTGNVWVANNGGGNVVELASSGTAVAGSPFSDLALQGTSAVAVDGSGNIWAPGSTTGTAEAGSVSLFANSGTAAGASPYSGGGLALPAAAATSGSKVWVTNGTANGTLSVLSNAGVVSPAAGFGSLNYPAGVAVDGSGNVWTANAGDNTVSVFVGLTAPVVTPLAANVGP